MAQGLFEQLVWDEASQSFVTYRTQEINPDPISYFIWDGSEIRFFLPSGVPYTYIRVVDYDFYDLPEFTGLYYNNMPIEPDEYSVNGGINLVAYYGAEPDHPDSPTPGIPNEGYTLHISYTHTYNNNVFEELSVQHYGAWVSNSDLEYVFYYDVNKNIQRIDRHILVSSTGVFDLTKFSSNLLGYSEENPYYGDAEVKYYLSEPAKVQITVVADEEGNVHGTTNPVPNEIHTLDVHIGDECIIYALPDLGYTVDHWEIWVPGIYEWVDVDYSLSSFVLAVLEPQYTYLIKVFFKKSETKIATIADLNSLCDKGDFSTSSLTYCPTLSTIKSMHVYTIYDTYSISVNGSYTDTQLVRFADCQLVIEGREYYYIDIKSATLSASGTPTDLTGWETIDGGQFLKQFPVKIRFYKGSEIDRELSTSIMIYGYLSGSSIVALNAKLQNHYLAFPTDIIITKIELVSSELGFLSGGSVQIDAANQGKDYTWLVSAHVVC